TAMPGAALAISAASAQMRESVNRVISNRFSLCRAPGAGEAPATHRTAAARYARDWISQQLYWKSSLPPPDPDHVFIPRAAALVHPRPVRRDLRADRGGCADRSALDHCAGGADGGDRRRPGASPGPGDTVAGSG